MKNFIDFILNDSYAFLYVLELSQIDLTSNISWNEF